MIKLEHTMRAIRADEIDMVAELISAGYYYDEFFIWSVGDDDERLQVVADYYKIYLGVEGCHAYVAEASDGRILGAAVWLSHDTDASIYDEIDRVTGVYHPQFRAVADWSHCSEPPIGPFYQLVGFVVLRELQGLGLGGELLRHELDKLDALGIPTYLEASTPYFGKGVYGKFGYQPAGELMVFADTAVLYPLWRPAGGCYSGDVEHGEHRIAITDIQDTCMHNGGVEAHAMYTSNGGAEAHTVHTPNVGAEAHAMRLSNNAATPAPLVRFGHYDWRAIAKRGSETLLLAENVIDLRMYHDTFEDTTWENSTARKHLNTNLYASFTPEEQARIIKTQINNRHNPWFGDDGGADTVDNIFLLSVYEAVRYLGGNGQPGGRDNFYIDDKFNDARKAVYTDGSPSRWMLRTPGIMPYMAVTVTINGRIAITGDFVNRQPTELFNIGLRPAMWVEL